MTTALFTLGLIVAAIVLTCAAWTTLMFLRYRKLIELQEKQRRHEKFMERRARIDRVEEDLATISRRTW